MRVLLTGAGGTVGPVVAQALRTRGDEVVPWDRSTVSPDDPGACQAWLNEISPDAVMHLAFGPEAWAELLARNAAERDDPFLYVSTVSVFGAHQRGPHTPDVHPEPGDDYGRYKRRCEEAVLAANPSASVARIGWQIGQGPDGNQMMAHLLRQQRDQGHIEVSRRWFQATSFLEDTVDALLGILVHPETGLFHVDGNPGLSFLELVTGLRTMENADWTLIPVDDPDLDNRMVDDRVPVRSVVRW